MQTFKGKRVVNRKVILFPNSSFFIPYLYKKAEGNNVKMT